MAQFWGGFYLEQLQFKINIVFKYLLGFLDIFRHGEENAVDKNGEHNDIVEVLVGGQEDI